jgi:hypothetical protein
MNRHKLKMLAFISVLLVINYLFYTRTSKIYVHQQKPKTRQHSTCTTTVIQIYENAKHLQLLVTINFQTVCPRKTIVNVSAHPRYIPAETICQKLWRLFSTRHDVYCHIWPLVTLAYTNVKQERMNPYISEESTYMIGFP